MSSSSTAAIRKLHRIGRRIEASRNRTPRSDWSPTLSQERAACASSTLQPLLRNRVGLSFHRRRPERPGGIGDLKPVQQGGHGTFHILRHVFVVERHSPRLVEAPKRLVPRAFLPQQELSRALQQSRIIIGLCTRSFYPIPGAALSGADKRYRLALFVSPQHLNVSRHSKCHIDRIDHLAG